MKRGHWLLLFALVLGIFTVGRVIMVRSEKISPEMLAMQECLAETKVVRADLARLSKEIKELDEWLKKN